MIVKKNLREKYKIYNEGVKKDSVICNRGNNKRK